MVSRTAGTPHCTTPEKIWLIPNGPWTVAACLVGLDNGADEGLRAGTLVRHLVGARR